MNTKEGERYINRWFAVQRGETLIDVEVNSYTEKWFKTPSAIAHACDVESVFPHVQRRLKEINDEKN